MPSPKTILITGCSEGGLGDALAREFHKKGFRVFATGRNPSKIAHFEALGIKTIILDVLKEDSIQAAVQEVSRMTGGKLDMLLNNSGGGYTMPLLDAEIPKVRDLFELNVFSNIAVIQAFIPLLMAAAPGSMIINNTSIAAIMGLPIQSTYNASKAAMSSFSNSLRMELEPFDIKVIDLRTGSVASKFFDNQNKKHGTEGTMTLPPNSYYALGKDVFEKTMDGSEITKGQMDSETWARQVVGDLTKKTPPPFVYRGTSAWVVWFAKTVLPATALDSLSKKLFGVAEFESRWRSQKKTA